MVDQQGILFLQFEGIVMGLTSAIFQLLCGNFLVLFSTITLLFGALFQTHEKEQQNKTKNVSWKVARIISKMRKLSKNSKFWRENVIFLIIGNYHVMSAFFHVVGTEHCSLTANLSSWTKKSRNSYYEQVFKRCRVRI